MAIDAYDIGINNLDVKLVVQWDISLKFDWMIQQIGQAGRKDRTSSFILLTPKQTKIKDPDKIEQRSNNTSLVFATSANTQLSDSNWPKDLTKASFLSIIYNLKHKLSDSELVAVSEANYDLDGEADIFFEVLAMDVDLNRKQQKKNLKVS